MTLSPKTKTIIQLALGLLIAFGLKYHYSTATVDDLRWILAPTTFLVESITGRHFEFESRAGYMSDDHTFLIAASCSGVNFVIIAFLVLTLGKIRGGWPRLIEWRFIPMALFAAYFATLFANTTRIVVSLASQPVEASLLDREELHRLEGIVVYFGFLLLLFVASEMLSSYKEFRAPTFVRHSWLPLMIYYGVTLGVPLVNGAFRESAFWRHSIFVIALPLAVIGAFRLIAFYTSKQRKKYFQPNFPEL